MKIVYCIVGTFNSGGMERVLANKANYLVNVGHELVIVTTDQRSRSSYFELDQRIVQIDLGINYTSSAMRGLLKKLLYYPFKQKQHKQRLRSLLASLKADVVISMFDHDATFLYQIKDGSKKVLEIHFSRFKRLQYGRTGLWGRIDRFRSKQDLFVAGRYDRFVVLTAEDKTYWGNLANMAVIPNANSFEPAKEADLDRKRVIAVGRFDDQKAFDELIMAWKMVHVRHPDWSLDLFGAGPLKAALQALIYSLDLQAVVHLCSPVRDIEQEYVKSAMLVMTSRYEGLPMVLLEGQACGLPLLSYACKCGPRDIITHGKNGYLLAEGDREGLARKLTFLMDRPTRRKMMGQCSQRMSANYRQETIMQHWIDLFGQITGKDHK